MALTEDITVIGDRLVEILQADDGVQEAGFAETSIWYGERSHIRSLPCIQVLAGTVSRVPYATGHSYRVELPYEVIVYHSRIEGTAAAFTRELDELAQTVAAALAPNHQLRPPGGGDPLVVHSFVAEITRGTAVAGGARFAAKQLGFRAQTRVVQNQTQLPTPPPPPTP
jgi:hypothetical protein